jgi:hypothetical protein
MQQRGRHKQMLLVLSLYNKLQDVMYRALAARSVEAHLLEWCHGSEQLSPNRATCVVMLSDDTSAGCW